MERLPGSPRSAGGRGVGLSRRSPGRARRRPNWRPPWAPTRRARGALHGAHRHGPAGADGHACNTELAETCLVPGRPLYRGEGILHGADLYFRWAGLADWVRHGTWPETPAPPPHGDAPPQRRFILAMHNYSVAGRAQALALAVDLTGARRLLDLGGGPGTYSIALCQRFPGLEATLLDLAPTQPFAREVIEAYGMQDRVRLQAGSWDDEDWGHDYDAVLMSNVLHGRGEANQAKMRWLSRHCVRAGSSWCRISCSTTTAGAGDAALFNINVAAYRLDALMEDLRAAGFTDVRHVPLRSRRRRSCSAASRNKRPELPLRRTGLARA